MKPLRAFLLLAIGLLLAGTADAQVKLKAANLQHGTYTDGSFNFSGQAAILSAGGTDIVAAQEVSIGADLTAWDSGFTTGGMTRAVFQAHWGSPGDGNAIWYRSATTSVVQTFTHDLTNGVNPTSGTSTAGWNGQDPRRTIVATRFSHGGKQFDVVSVHLCAALCEDNSSTNFASQRVDQINDLISWANSTLTGGLPRAFVGDFNFPVNYPRAPEHTLTADAATDTITVTGHGWANGTPIVFRTAGTIPAGLATGDSLYAAAPVFYVRDVTANTFKVSSSQGGAAIDLTSAGTGSNFVAATQWGLFLENGFTDLWQLGLANGTATANWGDRDENGQPDMPLDFQLTRSHDSRRIDFAFGSGFSLVSFDVPDLRATCSVALTTGGNFKQCPDVTNLIDFPDDQGVEPSDHNFLTITVTLPGGSKRKGRLATKGKARI